MARKVTIAWMPSPNFWPGRKGHSMAVAPSYIVLHTTVGTREAAAARFLDPNSQVSAHYIVGLDGSVTQLVSEVDAAWHAGTEAMNLDSIGIEHEDGGRFNDPRPDALYQASATLVRAIVSRYPGALAIDAAHIIPHRQVVATACPDALDVARIIRQAQEVRSMAAIIRGDGEDRYGKGSVYVTDGLHKRHLTTLEEVHDLATAFSITGGDADHVTNLKQTTVDAIPEGEVGSSVSGGGSLILSLTGTAMPK
jgi:N-acetylmuramoyl-L-alanine amidase CwlA